MKVLGFNFSNEPHMDEDVRAIKRKFWSRKWILNHLGHNRFTQSDLLSLTVYQIVILLIHDYCGNVYHTLQTKKLEAELERLQAVALKNIYGYEYYFRQLLASKRLTALKDRRQNKMDRLAKKAASGKFSIWFLLNELARVTRWTPK